MAVRNWWKLVATVLALGGAGCPSADESAGAAGGAANGPPAPSVPSGPDAEVTRHQRLGKVQGPVPRASLAEAAVMIVVDWLTIAPDGICHANLIADVLERAGYSVWGQWSPCLEGQYLKLHVGGATLEGKTSVVVEGVFWNGVEVPRPEVMASVLVDEGHQLTRSEVETLVSELLRAPQFRRLVGRVRAEDSANLFGLGPVTPATSCAAGSWLPR